MKTAGNVLKIIMRYIIDNDLHIHSYLSLCSKDEKQNPCAILDYAKENSLKRVCITDHYWDSSVPCNTAVNWWYEAQGFDHISECLPLPQDNNIKFLFGCEADMDSTNRIGLSKSRYDDFGFIIVSTTHFHHMSGGEWEDTSVTSIAKRWIKRMYAVLESELPFYKTGIAHPACRLICRHSREDYLKTLSIITNNEYENIFKAAANKGIGIEINADDFNFSNDEADTVLRMFRIAKECGCKFYLGSDAHHNSQFKSALPLFEKAIDLLSLEENDKFII